MTDLAPLTIVSLDITNFARIKAVRMEPDASGAVVISGNNAQGKSSVLDAIATLIDSNKNKVAVPVHMGADAANIVAVFGRAGEPELVVKWKQVRGQKKSLVVEDADGIKKSSPASLMKSLFGFLAVDPYKFATSDPDEQLKILLATTGFDVDEWRDNRKKTFEQRTVINREAKKRAENLKMIEKPLDSTPREPVATSTLLKEREDLTEALGAYRTAWENVEGWDARVVQLEMMLAEARSSREQSTAYAKSLTIPDQHRLADVNDHLENADDLNKAIRDAIRYDELSTDHQSFVDEAKKLSTKIESHDEELRKTIDTVEIPIRGLAYNEDDGITLDGIPFTGASHAEKLTIGTALAIAAQPDAGVILIEDASLMDASTTQVIVAMAEKHGMQIWMETVGTEDGFVIEDGELAHDE